MLQVRISDGSGVHQASTDKDAVTVGRATNNDLVLADKRVSRHHARLIRRDDAVYVEDLGGINGTRVNDRLLHNASARVADGDAVFIGPYQLFVDASTARDNGDAAHEDVEGTRQIAATSGTAPVLAVDAPGHKFTVRVLRDQVTIGRAETNDVGLDVPSLSMHHAALRRRGDHWQLMDLHSREGTTIDGRPVKEALLSDGESFRLGPDVTVTFRLAGRATSPTMPESHSATIAPGQQLLANEQAPVPAPAVNRDAARSWARESTSQRPVHGGWHEEVRRRTIPHSSGAARIRVGRAATNDLVLGSPVVSLEHAVIERAGTGTPWLITDVSGLGQTFVNRSPVRRQQLSDGDVIRIGPYQLAVEDGEIEYVEQSTGVLLQALELTRRVGKKTILQKISLMIQPGEFVAVVGVSGSGKTTLLNALSGVRPATTGQVLIDGYPLYQHFASLRTAIGYVPQDDIVHRELPVERALDYAARLRMPAGTSREERAVRVNEVIDELGLREQRKTVISKLSGGERKRVSIGVELLTKPPLFCLDEPTSGLDPVTASKMMDQLRLLADQGRTVVLVTHATRDISLCDKVLFLTQGGRMAFYGTPRDAPQYFDVAEFEDIYDQIEHLRTPEEWEARFRESETYQAEIVAPLVRLQAATLPAETNPRPDLTESNGQRGAGSLRQFGILTRRYADTTLRDHKHLAILLLQAPIIALLFWGLFKRDVFTPPANLQIFAWHAGVLQPVQRDAASGRLIGTAPGADLVAVSGKDCAALIRGLQNNSTDCHIAGGNGNNVALKAAQLAFLLAAVAVWLGTLNAIREISKEHAIYWRERMVNLRILPYVGSKLAVLWLLVIVQTATLLAVVAAYIHFPTHLIAGAWFSLILGGAASVAVALAVSAAVANSDRAIVAAPLIMVPQILFAGGLTPVQELNMARPLAALVATRWCFEAVGRTFGITRLAGIAERFPQTPALTGPVYLPWLALGGFIAVFTSLALILQKLKDRR